MTIGIAAMFGSVLHGAEKLPAVHARHHQVEQHDARHTVARDDRERRVAVFGGGHVIAALPQQIRNRVA